MKLMKNECYHGFKLTHEETISEVKGTGRLFEHQQSGARLIHIDNDDPNKVFTMTFKTPPTDNTGVAHIVEHAVCCASKKYPLKDTFVEMDKGSLNTALNACTYKDMTMYYCASQNEKDLFNLMEVYIDLVFNPLMFERNTIFKQEGWHYALEELEDEITYNGIVYNEMKGEYAEASTLLECELHKALFPESIYRFDSGGVPEAITTLSEADFGAFYHKYYKPSNATFYLYGNGDVMAQLELINTLCLSKMTKEEVSVEIPLQPPLQSPVKVKRSYAVGSGQSEEDKHILALSFVVGEVTDTKLRLAFQILEHMLLKSAASPMAEALISEAKLGKVLEEVGYDPGKRQPTFSFVISGAGVDCEEKFERKVWEVLRSLVKDGIDPELLGASLHTVTFGLKEGESQSEPKGVLYSEDVQMSMLYGGEPFAHLAFEKDLEALTQALHEGYFEQLIDTYFLQNSHRALVVLAPDEQIGKTKEEALNERLRAYKKSLSKKQLKQLIKMNEVLDQFQDEPNNSDDLDLLPTLSKSDLRREIEPIALREEWAGDAKIVWQEEDTNGIVYLHLLFDTRGVAEEDIPYIGLLSNVLTYIGTKNYTYHELENAINSQTGGVNCSINAYGDCLDTDAYEPFFKISSKVLGSSGTQLLALLQEIITATHFRDVDKMKEIIRYVQYEMERSFAGTPEYRATRRLNTYFSDAAVYEDQVSGIAYYEMISKLGQNFEHQFELVAKKLEYIYKQIMSQNNLKIYVTCSGQEQQAFKEELCRFIGEIPKVSGHRAGYSLKAEIKNEAYITTNEVQAIAKGFNFKKSGFEYDGGLHVATNLINSTYLWDKVRLQGGAYGCELAVGRDGNLVVCSYCDPSLVETIDVFDGMGEYLRNLEIDGKELLKYTIGTIGAIDYPMTMEQRSERAIAYDLCHLNPSLLQKERDEILDVTLEKIKSFAILFDELGKNEILCVVGGESVLRANGQLFQRIRSV